MSVVIIIWLDENLNFLSMRKDWKLEKEDQYLSISAGLVLGWISIGYKYEPNYNETGFSFLTTIGTAMMAYKTWNSHLHFLLKFRLSGDQN